jgi:hypothetical protein
MSRELKLTLRTWAIIAAVALWMLTWMVGTFLLIGDRPPPWNLGGNPAVPGDSYYTAGEVPTGEAGPTQVELPPTKGKTQ